MRFHWLEGIRCDGRFLRAWLSDGTRALPSLELVNPLAMMKPSKILSEFAGALCRVTKMEQPGNNSKVEAAIIEAMNSAGRTKT